MRLYKGLNEEDQEVGGEGWPDGGSDESLQKGVESFAENHDGKMPEDEGGFEECVNAMENEKEIDNPQAFCASIRDEVLNREDGRGED